MTEFKVFPADRRIIPLWTEAFGDSEEYITNALSLLSESAVCAAVVEDDRILSQCLLIEHRIDGLIGLYVYAACTQADRRGEGLFARLLANSSEYAADWRYDFLSLIPARGLAPYYEKQGFTKRLPISAAAAPEGVNDFYFSIPTGEYTVTECDVSAETIYAASNKALSLNAYCYALESISEHIELCAVESRDRETGYVVRHRVIRDKVFTISPNLAHLIKSDVHDDVREFLLLKAISDRCAAITHAQPLDPLPR